MLNDKIAELYRQTEKQSQTAQERKQQQISAIRWYQDNFVKKILIALVVILAISAIAGIVFSFLGYMEMRDSLGMLKQIK